MAIVTSRANLSRDAVAGLHVSSSQTLSDLVCEKQSKFSVRYSGRRMCRALKDTCAAMKVSPAASPSTSLYDALSVPENVGCAELKRAYWKKVRTEKNTCAAMKVSPAASPSTSLYDVLSVPQNVGCAELKRAYRKKVRTYHPDVCPPDKRDESCKMFLRVQEAYETLSDPYLRAGYDYLLHSNPVSVSEVRDWSESKAWIEQLQGLTRRSTVSRNTWGGRIRRFQEEEGGHRYS